MEQNNVDLQVVFDELQKNVLNPELINDNKLHFKIDDDLYRVRMPNQRELAEANDYRAQKYIELIQQKNTLTIKKLTQVLKDVQEIDIATIDGEIKDLENQLMDVYLSLAKKKDGEDKSIKKCEDQIAGIKNNRLSLVIEKAGYLAPAIENQAQDEYYKHLTVKCTDKYTEQADDQEKLTGNWSKVWRDYVSYEDDTSKLAYVALGRLTELALNI